MFSPVRKLRKRARGLLPAAALFVAASTVPAGALAQTEPTNPPEARSTWQISGFGTLGMAHVNSEQPWTFGRELTQKGLPGSFGLSADSRLGLQLNWQPAPKWEAVAQVVLKDRPPNASSMDSLEWAFLAYRPTPAWTVRLGRTSPDLFLLADARNVGYAFPWIRPNVEFYGWMPFSSMDGIDVTHAWRNQDTDWKIKLAMGSSRSTIALADRNQSLSLEGNEAVAATLSREQGPWLFKASAVHTRLKVRRNADFDMLVNGLNALGSLPIPGIAQSANDTISAFDPSGITKYVALSLQYDEGPWLAQAEISKVMLDRGISGGQKTYASLAYRWPKLTGFVIAGKSRPDSAPLPAANGWGASLAPFIGPVAAAQAEALGNLGNSLGNASRFDQHSIGIGVRWEARNNLAFKFQVDRIHVNPFGAGNWRMNTGAANDATVVSASAEFVF